MNSSNNGNEMNPFEPKQFKFEIDSPAHSTSPAQSQAQAQAQAQAHSRTILVGDEYRTNPMSLQPGGYVVEVHKRSGKVLVYDKIKKPDRYLREVYPKINSDADLIERITVDGNDVFHRGNALDTFELLF